MCTNRQTIYNNSKFVNLHYFDVFREVDCGKCLACQHKLQIEYAIRCYYEYRHAKDDGGFTYWDTLTMDDDHLSTFEGYPCFDRSMISGFMKRLRTYFKRKYSLDKDVLRFFCVSEYGERKHRPHFHIVFFVHDPKLSVEALQSAISECWKYGLTANSYRLAKSVARYTDFIVRNNAALTYVAKYLYKDDTYTSKYIDEVEYQLTQKGVEFEKKDIERAFRPFRLSSINFGSYLLELGEYDFDEESCKMPVALNVDKTFSLPMYYRRKLYYHLVKFEDGKLSWQKNSDYAEKLLNLENERFENDVIQMSNRINSVDSLYNLSPSISAFIDAKYSLHHIKPSEYIQALMDGRDVRLLVLYKRYFRGRYCATVEQVNDVIEHRSELVQYFHNNPLYIDDKNLEKDSREWYRNNMIHDQSYPDFYDFDKVLNFLDTLLKKYTRYSLVSDRALRIERKKLKSLSFQNPLY